VFADFYGQKKMVARIDAPATMGNCITFLAAAGNLIDRKSKVVVNLISGMLTSATEEEFLSGKNLALIGDEIIQFQRAKLLQSNQYQLSHLIRRKFGSPEAGSAVGQRFVLLDQAIVSMPVPDELIGSNIQLGFISSGHNMDMMQQLDCHYGAKCLQPLPPVHIRCGVRGGALNISWCRRSRYNGAWRSGVDLPLMEEKEGYLLELIGNESLVMQRQCDGPRAQIMLSSLPSPVDKIRLRQISAIFGLGEAAELAINIVNPAVQMAAPGRETLP